MKCATEEIRMLSDEQLDSIVREAIFHGMVSTSDIKQDYPDVSHADLEELRERFLETEQVASSCKQVIAKCIDSMEEDE